ncbi:hypothetical protein [Burkholderia cenocepacia]|uniref:hypothetical protein n=1 Tax=Burkholderia cenocepacia TaxID=95486 RepID=UPI002237628B|nr:hypothetical protein [Burkholderia cenocepacia]MCW5156305.1 hypothetical protein [Burkholderia cenocepacia]
MATKEQAFFLEGVPEHEIKQVAFVLANNLSADKKHTQPEIISIQKVDHADNGLFHYIGKEKFTGSAGEFSKYIKELIEQKILACPIHNWGDEKQDNFTELYKFKT